MDVSVPFRAGSEEDLAEEFIKTAEEDLLRLEASDLTDPEALVEENILAVLTGSWTWTRCFESFRC